ncbi:hypothetical protein GCM10010275_43240 [Streptomyces litmocidini]|nr:hypothetical protein GCM10010275_43240 [Streptomyces litmocidini]
MERSQSRAWRGPREWEFRPISVATAPYFRKTRPRPCQDNGFRCAGADHQDCRLRQLVALFPHFARMLIVFSAADGVYPTKYGITIDLTFEDLGHPDRPGPLEERPSG